MTVIVPTMWYSDEVWATIGYFIDPSPFLKLILIDNRCLGFEISRPSISWVKPSENLMVNQSWNYGVGFADDGLICLLNDDISLNILLLARYADHWFQDPGLGMVVFNDTLINGKWNDDLDDLGLLITDQFGAGYGSMMILRKSQYSKIPKSMKVFCGDDWIRHHIRHVLKLQTAEVTGLDVRGKTGVTSSQFQHLMEEDVKAFELCKSKLS